MREYWEKGSRGKDSHQNRPINQLGEKSCLKKRTCQERAEKKDGFLKTRT